MTTITKTTTTKTQPKKTKANIAPTIKVMNKTGSMVYKVPHCAEHYFETLVDPFSAEAGACVPCDLFPLPSQKVRCVLRGTLALGTTGHGWIVMRPVFANDDTCVRHTTSTSVGTNITALNSFTNMATVPFPALPYNLNDTSGTNSQVKCRIVGVGIRVKYIGTLMNQQGIVFGLEEPDHEEMRNFSIDEISAYQYSSAQRVGSKDWDASVCYSGPTRPDQLEYIGSHQLSTHQYMGFAIAGGAGDKFEYEIVEHLEYIGSKCPGRTPSHADAHAFGKVVETTKTAAASQPLQPQMIRPLWQRFKDAVVDGIPRLASGAVQVVSSAFSGDLTKLMSGASDLYKGVNPAVRALLENPAQRGHQISSPYLALPPPKLLRK